MVEFCGIFDLRVGFSKTATGMERVLLSWVLFIASGPLLGVNGSRGPFTATSSVQHKSNIPLYSSHSASTSHPPSPAGRTIDGPAPVPSFLFPPSYLPAPSHSPNSAPYSSANRKGAPAPSPTPIDSYTHEPIYRPVVSPSGSFSRSQPASLPQSVKALPPPPPNLDCSSTLCTEPLTNSPPGSPCSCVLPMKVGLRVNVALYTFFPLVSELAQEIASGVLMEQSQVRIMGANAASGEPEKTIVLINLVPRGEKFDNNMSFLTYEKFWHKQISIKAQFFGNHDVLYVLYPGLPRSPAAPTRAFGYGNNSMMLHPFAIDVKKPKGKNISTLIAVLVLASIMTLILCIGVVLALFLRQRYHTHSDVPVLQPSLPPFTKSSAAGLSRFGSRLSSGSVSMNSRIATYIGSVKTFSLLEIKNATNKFEDSRVIGEGGFGLVYEGTLADGTQVAVKILKRNDQQGVREFMAEVEMLSRLHHRNLVKLLGICTEEYIHCLVYELIPNGSVESHLYGADKETAPLDWNSRMKIALGAARCLAIYMKIQTLMSYIEISNPAIYCWNMILRPKFVILVWRGQHWVRKMSTFQPVLWEPLAMWHLNMP